MSLTLPEPGAEEQAHSEKLQQRIIEAIDAAGGVLGFDRYMEMALYEPGLGYYVSGTRKLGADGDFVTAPEISPLFSRCLARQCAEVLRLQPTAACILEFGAGTGAMAADILAELEQLDCLPDHYYIMELSPDLAERQRATLEARVPHLLGSVRWLQTLDGLALNGVMLANEVLDAMPVRVFAQREGEIQERSVAYQGGRLVWRDSPADDALMQAVAKISESPGVARWPDGFVSELNQHIDGWLQTLSQHLASGAILLIDYGYPRAEYYHPQRSQGTLIGHYRQRAIEDPFWYPGLADITANVDFTAVAEAGVAAGLDLEGYTTQAWFLFANGIEQMYQQAIERADDQQRLMLSKQIKLLTLPAEMGERFQVIGFSRNLELPLHGFQLQDYCQRL